MFKFNELSILNNKLTIDVQVEEGSEYQDIYIEKLSMSNQDSYVERSIEGVVPIPLTQDFIQEADVYKTYYTFQSYVGLDDHTIYGTGKVEIIATEEDEEEEGYYWYTAKILSNNDSDGDDIITDGESWVGKKVKIHAMETDVDPTAGYELFDEEGNSYNLGVNLTGKEYLYKRVRIVLDSVTPYSLKDLLFIYVTAGGDISGLPCTEKGFEIHPVVDMLPFYCRGMNFVKSLGDTCNIPREFIDYILMYKAFELSLYTGNYVNAIQYFNDFKRVRSNSGIQIKQRRGGGCGCH